MFLLCKKMQYFSWGISCYFSLFVTMARQLYCTFSLSWRQKQGFRFLRSRCKLCVCKMETILEVNCGKLPLSAFQQHRARQSCASCGVRVAFKTWVQVGSSAHVLNDFMPQTSLASVKVNSFCSEYLLVQKRILLNNETNYSITKFNFSRFLMNRSAYFAAVCI